MRPKVESGRSLSVVPVKARRLGGAEVVRVEKVEGFKTELQNRAFTEGRQARVLDRREVEDFQVRADERAAPQRAQTPRGLQDEGVGVEPLFGTTQNGRLKREAGR